MLAIKKTLFHPRADAEAQRLFRIKIDLYKKLGIPIIYLDESGFAHDMPRICGYSPIGIPCYGARDWNAKGRTNVIGAIIGEKWLTVSLFNGTINSDVFQAWVKQDLLPKVPKGAVIVMDNAPFHKRQDIQDSIRESGCILEYLPPYSPHLNPIEQKWAHAKTVLKSVKYSIQEPL